MRCQVEFFEDSRGHFPVLLWLESLTDEVRIKLEALIDLLEDHGPTLDFPYSSQVEGKLRELRQRFGKTRYRVLYFFDRNRVAILLHGIIKDTERIEEVDKSIGRSRMNEHLSRQLDLKKAAKDGKAKKKK